MAFFKMLCCVVLLYTVGVEGLTELLRFSDLRALGTSEYMVRDWFHHHYGSTPDGIAMNYEGRFRTKHPPVTVQYPHWCYKKIGTVTYTRGGVSKSAMIDLHSQTVENRTPEEVVQEVTLKYVWEDKMSYSTSRTIGLTFSQGITIEAVFSAGVEYSFSTTTTSSHTTTQRREITRMIRVRVPGHSKRKVVLAGRTSNERVYYRAPISVYGWMGANFPHKVRGHYYWFSAVSQFFPRTSGTLNGVANRALVSDFHVDVSVAVALTT